MQTGRNPIIASAVFTSVLKQSGLLSRMERSPDCLQVIDMPEWLLLVVT